MCRSLLGARAAGPILLSQRLVDVAGYADLPRFPACSRWPKFGCSMMTRGTPSAPAPAIRRRRRLRAMMNARFDARMQAQRQKSSRSMHGAWAGGHRHDEEGDIFPLIASWSVAAA